MLAVALNNNMHICCGKESDNRTISLGSIDENDYKKFNNWITFTKDRVECYKKLYITTTWGGNNGLFDLDKLLNEIETRLKNLEDK